MLLLRSIVMSTSVYVVSVCLSVREDISGTIRAIFSKYLCMLLMASFSLKTVY